MNTAITSACVLIFIFSGTLSKNIGKDVRQCYWCGPLADQVNKSQRPPPCENGTFAVTNCDYPQQYCAIVASAPPYVESRLCVKIYQDECYPLYCNTTRSWKMTCPCKGDLCNGNKTDREEDAFAGLNKLVARIPRRDKRDLETHKGGEIKETNENSIKDEVKEIVNGNNNLKDDKKEQESNIGDKIEEKDSKIVNMASDSNNMDMKITTATVTPPTMNKDENSETKTTGITASDSTAIKVKKEETQTIPQTQTENIQKDVTVPKIESMQNDTTIKTEIMQNDASSNKANKANMQNDAPSRPGIMQNDAGPKPEIMQNDAASRPEIMQNDAASKPEIMQNDAASIPEIMQNGAASRPEIMQNDAASRPEIMQNDAASRPEIMQNDAASIPEIMQTATKPENMPKDSAQPSTNHEKSLPKTNPTDNNIERPPITQNNEQKKNDNVNIAPNKDMKTNSSLPGKVYKMPEMKQQKSNGVIKRPSLLLIPILGLKFLF